MIELLTVEQAAKGLGFPMWKMYELAREGVIPHTRIKKRIYFREETLVAWLEEQEQASVRSEGQEGIL